MFPNGQVGELLRHALGSFLDEWSISVGLAESAIAGGEAFCFSRGN